VLFPFGKIRASSWSFSYFYSKPITSPAVYWRDNLLFEGPDDNGTWQLPFHYARVFPLATVSMVFHPILNSLYVSADCQLQMLSLLGPTASPLRTGVQFISCTDDTLHHHYFITYGR
jgi:hypothetical protein